MSHENISTLSINYGVVPHPFMVNDCALMPVNSTFECPYPGVMVEIGHLMIEEVMGRKMNLIPTDTYGFRQNETSPWTGLVGQLVTGETYITMPYIDITYPRHQAIDYLPLGLFGLKRSLVVNPLISRRAEIVVTLPFEEQVWAMYGLIYVIAVFVCSACRHRTSSEKFYMILLETWYKFSLQQRRHQYFSKGTALRLLTVVWSFLGHVILTFYVAILIVFMTPKINDDVIFRNMKEIAASVGEGTYTFLLHTSDSSVRQESFSDISKHLSGRGSILAAAFERNPPLVLSLPEAMRKLVTTRGTSLLITEDDLKFSDYWCDTDLVISQESVGEKVVFSGFGISKNLSKPLVRRFTTVAGMLLDGGHIDRTMRRYTSNRQACRHDFRQQYTKIRSMFGLMMLLGSGLLGCGMVLVAELLLPHAHKELIISAE